MDCITWFTPILPGKLEAWKILDAELSGTRAADHKRSREQLVELHGLTPEMLLGPPPAQMMFDYKAG
jgi:hypothetical protein